MIANSLLPGALLVGVALPLPAAAQQDDRANPAQYPEDSYISLSGTVESAERDSFTLDFQGGLITVEMAQRHDDPDAYNPSPGDDVTVYGTIDEALFDSTTIEATRIFVDKLNTYFYANAVDEGSYEFITSPIDATTMTVQGMVSEVDDEELSINAGVRGFQVDLGELDRDPTDNEGYQQIEVGDVVSVTGEPDYDFIEGREIVARSVTTVRRAD